MKPIIRTHRDLRVWRRSTRLAEQCGALVTDAPAAGRPALERIARKARDLALKIEEGFATRQWAPYVHHLERARVMVARLEALLVAACGAGSVPPDRGDRLLAQVAEIGRMLRKLVEALELARMRRWRAVRPE